MLRFKGLVKQLGGQPMRASLFWFSDEQWAKIEPLIPMNRPGSKPQNNRTIVSGIMHVLKVGCRWQDCPPEYGPYTTAALLNMNRRSLSAVRLLPGGGRDTAC